MREFYSDGLCHHIDLRKVRETAETELRAELEREEIERVKTKLRKQRPLLHRLFPFVIKIERRD